MPLDESLVCIYLSYLVQVRLSVCEMPQQATVYLPSMLKETIVNQHPSSGFRWKIPCQSRAGFPCLHPQQPIKTTSKLHFLPAFNRFEYTILEPLCQLVGLLVVDDCLSRRVITRRGIELIYVHTRWMEATHKHKPVSMEAIYME